MEISRNAAIKEYICNLFCKEDESLSLTKKKNAEADLPKIAIPENVGKLLYILTKLQRPKRILEIGTLGGYSTIWFAQAAPKSEIVTLESDPYHAQIAQENFRNAKLEKTIELIQGNAHGIMQRFIQDKIEPFDLIFLDADKEGYPMYLPMMIELSRPGTLILTDNLIPKEEPINQSFHKDNISKGTYHYNSLLAENPRLETVLITTIVGSKGRLDALGASIVV